MTEKSDQLEALADAYRRKDAEAEEAEVARLAAKTQAADEAARSETWAAWLKDSGGIEPDDVVRFDVLVGREVFWHVLPEDAGLSTSPVDLLIEREHRFLGWSRWIEEPHGLRWTAADKDIGRLMAAPHLPDERDPGRLRRTSPPEVHAKD